MSRLRLALVVAVAAAALFAPGAGALPLHAITVEEPDCIHDVTGANFCGQTTNGLDGAFDVAVSPDGMNVYAAGGQDDAVVNIARDIDGTLTAVGCIDDNDTGSDTCAASADGLDGISTLVVSPDGRNVYGASALDDAIVVFNRSPGGALTPAGCIDDPDGGQGPDACGGSADGLDSLQEVAISPDGTSVYAVSSTDDAISRFTRAADGSLTFVSCIDDASGPETCTSTAGGLDGAFGVTVSPDGGNVYVASNVDDAVVTFDRAASGALSGATCIDDNDTGTADCAPGTDGLDEPRHVVVSPDGLQVYAMARLDAAVTRFDRDPADGDLTAISCVEDTGAPDACAQSVPGLEAANSAVISPDGEDMFVTGPSDSSVVHFDRATTGAGAGTLTFNACYEDNGGPDTCAVGVARDMSTPIGLDMPADGSSVFVAGEGNDAVVRLNREVPPRCFGHASSGLPDALQTIALDCGDPNGDAAFIQILSQPQHGTLGAVDQTANTVAFTPTASFTGADSFSFGAVADAKASNVVMARRQPSPRPSRRPRRSGSAPARRSGRPSRAVA
jgi:DNA-binding beta-propeller fold protein YncE